MNNKIIGVVAFAAGAVCGSLVTWKFLRTRYEQYVQEEIDSVKEAYSDRNYTTINTTEVESTTQAPVGDMPDLQEYAAKVLDLGYSKNAEKEEKKEEDDEMPKPYIISPEEFGEEDGYETITLTYYADGVLTDEADDPFEENEVEELVGTDFANHYGEYEDDTVFVRNDSTKGYYEICRDQRNWHDVYDL